MIKIRESVPDDVYGIREMEKITWINTYPNEEARITLEDAKSRFKDDDTPVGKQKMEERKKRYENKTMQTWVAENEGKIIGFCTAANEKGNGRILAIYVLPEHQRKGIGHQLITKGLEWLGWDKKIYINVVEYNSSAINFYKRHGFTETGVKGVFDSAASLPSGKSLIEIELEKIT
jgi:ribosomal protein S18 acetylase RimI-like enzyme